ncbi:MAG: DNA mismatch repair protein MutS [Chloroflexi bacterium]|nr:DNA mismatch repair protein MutS [Chloroflexota bacterium]
MVTPLRRQYLEVKRRYPDAIVLFRLGDFYETFDEDARTASRELEIALTAREMGKGVKVPLAGIPYHALDNYLGRLIRRGYTVAICEQITDPAASAGLVERDVVRVVTPGTLVEPSLLDQSANNYLVAVVVQGAEAGLAYADITTSEFATTQVPLDLLPQELARLSPAEVLLPRDAAPPSDRELSARMTSLEPEAFEPQAARETLLAHFGAATLETYGCEGLPLAVSAAGALLEYLGRTQKAAQGQLTSLHTYSTSSFMVLDAQTRRNLELVEGGGWGRKSPSLLEVLDHTRTSMGARLLRKWLGQPLLDLREVERRQEAVAWFHAAAMRRQRVQQVLASVSDLERLLNRARGGTAVPRDLVALRRSLEAVPSLKETLSEDGQAVAWLHHGLAPCAEVVDLLRRAIEDEPSGEPGDGGVIRPSFSSELDELRQASTDARQYIAGLEKKERERTGIGSLKVGYNKVFGYYIEVSNTNLSRVPQEYVRRQTLVGGERFYTPELKEHESLILTARERMEELERALFRQVGQQVSEAAAIISRTASSVALVDAFCGLAEAASRYGYVRPVLSDGDAIAIVAGRHPVVERSLPPGSFVPNDTVLSSQDCQLVVLTGPNMSGKSTYIRQVALIVLMAQIGSFVPAQEAAISLVDRIFTRVGLRDDLAAGQSTFMVEMVETARILHHATRRSLVVLDEIGRGTSTYDGLSIAQAVAEHLHNDPRLGCKTLFATHYHELTELPRYLPRARNYSVAVAEEEGGVVFLHRIVPGGAGRSYGVHVAQLAGLPRSVLNRAWEVLRRLEMGDHTAQAPRRRARDTGPGQLPLFGAASSVLEDLLRLDVSSLTPLEAINKLYELQQRAKEGGGPQSATGG